MTTTIPIDGTHADQFHRDGFTVVPELFTEDEIGIYRRAAQQFVDPRHRTAQVGLIATTDAWEKNETLRELALHPRLGAAAERLAGRPLRVWGGEILAKPPHEPTPSGLHEDMTFSLLDSALTFNAWIALVDVPVQRGAMTFLPGSHRRPGPERADFETVRGDAFATYLIDTWPGLQWNPRITVPVRAGGVTFHHNRTAHEAGPNSTDEIRLAFVVTFTDAGATYRPVPGSDPLPMRAGQPIDPVRYPRVGG
ncbi:phytanoyl-CoA dioxygenase family protein [Nocardia sp. ET3-3]|uniref:Phytanoyl-CoA dioxygenase family protein n=1 Tax=Nocardia terrae TaxID=2675851 RepID=A0A7K1V419_9NOCA|nr:phytanoyl-CoA dioxygenase family protein [Nocardia terrae]MVU81356.1 phytanoyl-CoA dioxygenase family protein [Nocardia terrae]